ncbi:PadR family transcriptional regulator [Paenibacillus glycinis]|uniref:PadR family transcriptional regulator n=1 Tax=Paenibacillus glycinis TaxID=2697035 RepID=A0ABW9XPU6_9BACL|nr:PadR family transcriptional regulator [Paenibacillus glycinis]NBD24576.1 PadR family transcriptional regulator [Paenibacillus glycinis]
MNTLSYGLLSAISIESCSGYDLIERMKLFWKADHSQIYPILGKLESQGYVRHESVKQVNKPDKKVYFVTDSGIEVLKKWMAEPTSEPVIRDEFALKMHSISMFDEEQTIALLKERRALYEQRLADLEARNERLRLKREAYGEDDSGIPTQFLGPFFLLEREILNAKTELKWCDWALEHLGTR